MTKYNFNNAVPFVTTHAGEVIKDELSARGMKQSELSALTGIQKPILNDVIKGRRSLTAEMALLIENAIGVPAQYLMELQNQYELDCAKMSERVVQQTKMLDIWNIIKEHVSILFFKKVGIVKGDVAEDVKRLFDVFSVDNVDDFLGLKAREMEYSYFRKSDKVTTNPVDIFSWKYYCYYLSRNDKTVLCPFNKHADMKALIAELNDIFKENMDTVNKVKMAFNKVGIRFLVVNKSGQVPVDGMSFWIDGNPTIVVTKRIDSIDNFAFTVLHETGHVFKHLSRDGNAMINLAVDRKSCEEKEADDFALNAILPREEWRAFMAKTRDVLPHKIASYIKKEAEEHNINPQLLFGRYKHDIGVYRIKKHFETKIL